MVAETHLIELLETREECPGVSTFRFSKPEGYAFVAGQYALFTIGALTKPFSHSQAPSDPYIEVTTRLSGSDFKKALAALRPGDQARLKGPTGRLVLPAEENEVVFLTGGIGVTPVRSMLREAAAEGGRRQPVLFYGNNEVTCVPFHDELERYAAEKVVQLVEVIGTAPPGWTGERGFITADTVRRHVDTGRDWLYVCTGPPPMAEAMRGVMRDLGVTDSRMMVEIFG